MTDKQSYKSLSTDEKMELATVLVAVVIYLIGWVCIIWGASIWTPIAAWLAGGLACIVTAIILLFAASQ